MQENFIVYKSSAGSGKTFTLVKEYLKIVLNDKSKVRNVLAITFTNAAAAEMKSRIIETLGKISKLNIAEKNLWDNSIQDFLKHVAGLSPDDNLPDDDTLLEIRSNASAVLSNILHNYGDFAVSTIDSFTHRIIRTFAFDLQIPLNFDIELDAKTLLNQAVDILISRVGTDAGGALTKVMVAYMESITDEEKLRPVEREIINLAFTILQEDLGNNVEKIKNISLDSFLDIQKKITAEIYSFENSIAEIAKSVVEKLDSANIPDEAFYQGKKGVSSYFRNLAAGLIEEKINPNSYVIKAFEEDKWFSKKCTEADEAAISGLTEMFFDAYNRINQIRDKGVDNYYLLKVVNKNIFPLAVLSEVEKILEEIKSQNSLLHISDFNKKIANIIAVQPVPFIYERLGEKYKHYMIDEFQDTSLLQWQNLLPLVENALANGNMNLVVGDCKQAIYRWRGGEVEQFAKLPEISPKIVATSKPSWQRALRDYYKHKPLDVNYRSEKEIVEFNNEFFKFIQENALVGEYAEIYSGVEQKYLPHKKGGYVQIDFIPADEAEDGKTLEDNTLEKTLELIHELHNEHNHPFSDITVLSRSNYHANLVARYLVENEIDVISQESLLLEFSPDVNFFISVLNLLLKPKDPVVFLEVISYLYKKGFIKNVAGIHDILKKLDEFPVNKSLDKGQHIKKLEALLKTGGHNIDFFELSKLNLWDLCEFLVKTFFSSKPEVNPYVAFFMDAVYDYLQKNPVSINDFVQWWEENKSKYSVVVPKGIDAVQVMTIHKAKGLQFPVVIFPFVNMSNTRMGLNGFWHDIKIDVAPELKTAYFTYRKDLENTILAEKYHEEKQKSLLDLLNVIYVAFTRPREKLFVLSNYPKKGVFKESANTAAYFLKEFLSYKEQWEEGLVMYQFGNNYSTDSQADTHEDAGMEAGIAKFNRYLSNDWRDKIHIRPVVQSSEFDDEQKLALARGRMMHKVMENILTKEDVERVLNKMFVNGEISREEQASLKNNIVELISSEKLSPYFSEGMNIMNEAAILTEDGRYYRPDRVVLSENKAVVMDYKTGAASETYKKQLLHYKALLQKMGYKQIEAYLVYLDEVKVEEVSL